MDEETQTLLTQWKMDDYIELFKALFEFEDSSDLLQWLENCTDPWDTVESHWIRTAGTRLKLNRNYVNMMRRARMPTRTLIYSYYNIVQENEHETRLGRVQRKKAVTDTRHRPACAGGGGGAGGGRPGRDFVVSALISDGPLTRLRALVAGGAREANAPRAVTCGRRRWGDSVEGDGRGSNDV
ncbi:hypothetical protein EVAR_90722_1 [Eumeta japonica]|uniref:Uncharacterized protein n=1 Tax=Eumeta variegata TaxID=151549 RepID=A0A4C1ZGX6_EUMVA|nr:hypothetical protein EVAR_90722_1 [Eumeta japonica]